MAITYPRRPACAYYHDGEQVQLYATFSLPMLRTVTPPLNYWDLRVDGAPVVVQFQEWDDDWTIHLASEPCSSPVVVVTLKYNGPSPELATSWGKDVEPFGPVVAAAIQVLAIPAGAILLWSGSVATIPVGWHLCDGTNGTPNLTNLFVVGAGDTYNPNDTGGTSVHSHTALTSGVHQHTVPGGAYPIGSGVNFSNFTTFAGGHTHTTDEKKHLPPYYALCYIMKL